MTWLQDYGLVFDVAICVLLVTTIGYAMVLNRKLTDLRSARSDMEKVVADFSAAAGKAQGGLDALKARSSDAGDGLAKTVDDACRLADEMAFLVKKGNEIADRLEVAVAASRKLDQQQGKMPGGLGQQSTPRAPMDISKMERKVSQSQHDTAAAPAKPVNGLAKLAKRKLSGSDSELMRTLQAMR